MTIPSDASQAVEPNEQRINDAARTALRYAESLIGYEPGGNVRRATILKAAIVTLHTAAIAQDRAARAQAEPVAWQPMETAPVDGTPILALCQHTGDAYYDGDRLTAYGARAEGLSHVEDGPHVIVWGESYEVSDGWENPSFMMPAGWELSHDCEVMANPIGWMPIPGTTIPQVAEVPGCDPTQTECKRCRNVIANCDGVFSAALTPTASAPKACPHGDRFCPCPDGDTCHYEGANPLPAPKAEAVTCERCGHENWIMEGKAPCQITTADKQSAQAAPKSEGEAHPNLTERLQQKCSDWNTYWRAPDAHGVILSPAQAVELLQDALGVEVEITQPPSEADRTREGGDVVAKELLRVRGWAVFRDSDGEHDGREFVEENDPRPALVEGWSWKPVDMVYLDASGTTTSEGASHG